MDKTKKKKKKTLHIVIFMFLVFTGFLSTYKAVNCTTLVTKAISYLVSVVYGLNAFCPLGGGV